MTYFVGRSKELDLIIKMGHQSQTGIGATVFITGEAGIGKTELIEQAIKKILLLMPNFEVAKGYCNELTGIGDPFSPFFQALDSLFEKSKPSKWLQGLSNIPTWLLQISNVSQLINASSIIKYTNKTLEDFKTFNPVIYDYTKLITDLSKECPLIIIIEDLHWADESSLNLLYYLSKRIANLPVLLICAFRPTDLKSKGVQFSLLEEVKSELERSNSCSEIALNFLSLYEYTEYTNQQLSNGEFQESKLLDVYHLTNGNPLFISEMFKFLSDQSPANKNLDESFINLLPTTLDGVLRKRIGSLPNAIGKTIKFASVEGELFTSIPLSRLESQNEIKVSERLDILQQKFKLITLQAATGFEGSTYKFVHALVRAFCYKQLGASQQVVLHKNMGAILEDLYQNSPRINYSRLAYHFEKGGIYQKATKYYLLATNRAFDTYAYHETLKNAEQGMSLLSFIDDVNVRFIKVEFLVKIIASRAMLGEYNIAIDICKQCILLCEDLIQNRPVITSNPKLEMLLNRRKILNRDLLLIDEKIADYPLSVDVPFEIQKEKLNTEEDLKSNQNDISREQTSQERQQYAGDFFLSECYRWLGYCSMHKDSVDYDASIAAYEKSLKLKEDLNNSDNVSLFLLELGDSYRRKGNTTDAIKTLEKSLEIQMNRGEFSHRALTLLTIAWVYLRNLKEFDKALYYCAEGLKFCEIYPDNKSKQQLTRACGTAYRQKGNYKLAEENYLSALHLAKEMEDQVQEAISINSLGVFYTDVGDWDKALECYVKSLKIREALGAVVGVENHNVGCAYQRIGNLDDAQKYFEKSLELYKRGNGIYGIYFNLRELGGNFFIRGDFKQSLYYVEECLSIAKREGYPAKGISIIKAHILLFQDNLKEANDLYKNAMDLKGGKEDEIASLAYISRCEYLLDHWDEATNSCKRSLLLAKEHEHKLGISLANLYYGKALINKDLVAAILCCQDAFEKLKSLNSYHVIDAALTLYMMFTLSKNLPAAEEMFAYAQNKSTLVNQKHKTLEIQMINSLYLRQKGRLHEAERNLIEVVNLSKKSDYLLLSRISNYYLNNLQSASFLVYPL